MVTPPISPVIQAQTHQGMCSSYYYQGQGEVKDEVEGEEVQSGIGAEMEEGGWL